MVVPAWGGLGAGVLAAGALEAGVLEAGVLEAGVPGAGLEGVVAVTCAIAETGNASRQRPRRSVVRIRMCGILSPTGLWLNVWA